MWSGGEVFLDITLTVGTTPERFELPERRESRKLETVPAVVHVDKVPEGIGCPRFVGKEPPLVVELGLDAGPHLVVKNKVHQTGILIQQLVQGPQRVKEYLTLQQLKRMTERKSHKGEVIIVSRHPLRHHCLCNKVDGLFVKKPGGLHTLYS